MPLDRKCYLAMYCYPMNAIHLSLMDNNPKKSLRPNRTKVSVSQESRVQIPYRTDRTFFFSGLIFTNALRVFITAQMAFVVTSLPAAHTYDVLIFAVSSITEHNLIASSAGKCK